MNDIDHHRAALGAAPILFKISIWFAHCPNHARRQGGADFFVFNKGFKRLNAGMIASVMSHQACDSALLDHLRQFFGLL